LPGPERQSDWRGSSGRRQMSLAVCWTGHQGGKIMADYYLGQITALGFDFAPRNFAQASGQLMAIAQNQALFSLLGTMYGGNGTTTFQLPDLRGRTPIGGGTIGAPGLSVTNLGQVSGTETVTLISSQIPMHNHLVNGTTGNGTIRNPRGALYASTPTALYSPYPGGTAVVLDSTTLAATGGTQPHQNMQPYLVINFSIALSGIFPSRN
jgi:microcystin-dependent protein